MSKWKFILTDSGWWLRIESIDQLLEYQKLDRCIQRGFNDVLKGNDSQIAQYLRIKAQNTESTILDTAYKLQFQLYDNYISYLQSVGFVNINKDGGCNGERFLTRAVVYSDNLVFPHFTEKDIRVETFESADYRSNYQYHWYAYLGTIQLHDGDKMKWDTKAEAMEFARRYING